MSAHLQQVVAKAPVRMAFVLWALIMMDTGVSEGYIMPAEQVLQFMAENFSKFKTLVITQTTEQVDPQGAGAWKEGFTEKLWMKSPDFFRSKILDEKGAREVMPDTDYRHLLIANSPEYLTGLLSRIGINLESVGFTRIHGIIAYRIGDEGDRTPKFLVEKDRFLPLLLKYQTPGGPLTEIITVEFKDYRRLSQGWYPYEITYSVNDEIRERYLIHDFEANLPIDPSLFGASETKPRPGSAAEKGLSPQEEERLREIIKTFQDKYR